ncbi:glycerophosphoryl diester phosphodiesterase membrane domain-containing protein [Flaviflexus huanghaiensis]|uniref:glycerophosphoryl diester phosphodiesterase membrane domain-containing protein n=1 Tax=Flaviflexus huanghaiensis TaxID=1111473 RepID=UPI0015F7D267|nr:glycerophosphoryl diester phosphodiesterase membrane domain-containing protein [Flaviflexus huanghaiensis]
MSNDDQRWHPHNDDDRSPQPHDGWDQQSDGQGWKGEAPNQNGQSPENNPQTFGYFNRPTDQPSYGEYSSYGQFGQGSNDYQPAPYGGLNGAPFPLHPLTPLEQIDAAIRLVRYNPKVLVLLPLIVYLVAGLLSTVLLLTTGETSLTTIDPLEIDNLALTTGFAVVSILSTLISFIAALFIYTTAVNAAMSAVYGRKISIGQALSMSTRDSGRLALAYFLYTFLAIVALTLVALLLFPLADAGDGAIVIFFLVLMVAMFYFGVRLSCAVPVLVAEQRGPIDAIVRSFQLTRGRFWSVFATLAAAFVLMIVISIVLSIIVALFSFLGFGTTTGAVIYSTITGALISAVVIAVTQAVANVIYINLRMVRENFHYDVRRQ